MRSEKESKLKAKAALKGTSAAEYRFGLACETSMAASICCCLIAPAVRSTAISLQRCEGNAFLDSLRIRLFPVENEIGDILKGNPAEGACTQSRPRALALLSVPLVSQGGRAMDAYFTSSSA
jgi:hypothetical protein